MKKILFCGAIIVLIFAISPLLSAQVAIIPKPAKITILEGKFTLHKYTTLFFDQTNPELKRVIDLFRIFLKGPLGAEINYSPKKPESGYIELTLDSTVLNKDGYVLRVTPAKIEIKARSAAGAFYAFQTLRQMLPAEIENQTAVQKSWEIPAVEIEDSPRFEYRGFMLDVARHFNRWRCLNAMLICYPSTRLTIYISISPMIRVGGLRSKNIRSCNRSVRGARSLWSDILKINPGNTMESDMEDTIHRNN